MIGGELLLIGLIALLLVPREPRRPLAFVVSDTVVHTEAIGFCALARGSGSLQGRIVGIDSAAEGSGSRYRVRRPHNAAAAYPHPPASIVVVRCENYSLPEVGGN